MDKNLTDLVTKNYLWVGSLGEETIVCMLMSVCPCPYVSMFVPICFYPWNIFDAHVCMFLCSCSYIYMLIDSMLVFLCLYVSVHMFLCSKYFLCSCSYMLMLVHLCFYALTYYMFMPHVSIYLCPYVSILVSIYFYACVRMFLCLCPYISMVVSRCFYAHTCLFQCTYPYISLLEHNLCLCPYVPMLVSLCFYARNIFYAPVPIFLCSHKFSIRKFLENIFTMDLKLCIKISRILWWKPYVSWIFEWSIIEKKLKERWQVGGGRLGNLRLVGWDWLGLPILIGNLELRIVSDVQ